MRDKPELEKWLEFRDNFRTDVVLGQNQASPNTVAERFRDAYVQRQANFNAHLRITFGESTSIYSGYYCVAFYGGHWGSEPID